MTTVAELVESRELFVNLTLRELRGKYKRSVLGWAWSLLNPLATMVIFTVVFAYFLKSNPAPGDPSGIHFFAFFLLAGLLPWNFLSSSISGAMGSLIGNSNLIKKVYFPREALVASNLASWLVSFLIELGVLCVVLMVAGYFVLPWMVPLVGLIVLQTIFALGLGLLMGVLSVYFRDLEHLISIVLQIWFYSTPIVYPIDLVQKALVNHPTLFTLYKLNPMVRFVNAYRACLYDMRWPAFTDVAYITLSAAAALAIGIFAFAKLEPKLAEEL